MYTYTRTHTHTHIFICIYIYYVYLCVYIYIYILPFLGRPRGPCRRAPPARRARSPQLRRRARARGPGRPRRPILNLISMVPSVIVYWSYETRYFSIYLYLSLSLRTAGTGVAWHQRGAGDILRSA